MEYVFVVRGRLGESLEEALRPSSVRLRGATTEVTLEIEDDAHLYGVLARLERLAISFVSFEPAKGASGTGASSSSTNR